MAGRASYTDADKAQVYVALIANDGNVKRTSREMGVPENTVRRWKREWEENGPPNLEEVEEAAGNFLEEATDLRGKALQALRAKVEILLKSPKDVKVAELTTLLGVLDDKITRASGLAMGRVEHVHRLPSPDEIRAALQGAHEVDLAQARDRQADIEDAEIIEEEPRALPAAS